MRRREKGETREISPLTPGSSHPPGKNLAPGLNKKVLNTIEQENALKIRWPFPVQFLT